MRKGWWTIWAVLLLLAAAAPAQAQFLQVVDFGWEPSNSWMYSYGIYGVSYDEVQHWHRADLDLGGGRFKSPWMDHFRSADDLGSPLVEDPTWSVRSASPTRIVAKGATVGLDPRYVEAWRLHFDGTAGLRTGWEVVLYNRSRWVGALEMTYDTDAFPRWVVTRSLFDPGSFLDNPEVPEPTALLLFAVLFTGLGFAAWRRRQP